MLIHGFVVDLNWLIINKLSQLERFTGEWSGIIVSEGHGLKQLKSLATVSGTGAAVRMDGACLTDEEIEDLITNLDLEKLEDAGRQQAAGYFETLDLVSEAWPDLPISESAIRSLQKVMLKYSVVEPASKFDDAERKLVDWYKKEKEVHPLVRAALFIYGFLSIHGDGRFSRLLTTWLLLKEGYGWIEYISLEQEIERRKNEYNQVIVDCQRNHPGENITAWIAFFIDCLVTIQHKLKQKLETRIEDISISPRVQQIRQYVEHHGGVRTGEIAENLGIPLPTVKKEVSAMVASGMLVRHGSGAGTNYTAKPRLVTRPDQTIQLGKQNAVNSFQIMQPGGTRRIKKIVLTPLFKWVQPDEWSHQLHRQGMLLEITCTNCKGISQTNQFALVGFLRPYLFQPVFSFKKPIIIPDTIMDRTIYQYEYPWQVSIQLQASVPVSEWLFDVFLIYDAKE
jgi:Uncharacterized conserved protein